MKNFFRSVVCLTADPDSVVTRNTSALFGGVFLVVIFLMGYFVTENVFRALFFFGVVLGGFVGYYLRGFSVAEKEAEME